MRRAAVMPILGESVSEGIVTAWLKQPGDDVRDGEPLFEVSTDKVDSEVPARFDGILVEILVAAGETAKIGAELAILETTGDVPEAAPAGPPVSAASVPVREQASGTTTSLGTPDERRHRRLAPLPARAAHVVPTPIEPAPSVRIPEQDDAPTDGTFVPFSPGRRATGARMVSSLHSAAHTLAVMEVDYERVEQARRKARDEHGLRLTYLPFVSAAVASAARRFPDVNAHVHPDGLQVFDQVHLGVAVDLEGEGLVVPVIRNAGALRVTALADRIADVARRARSRRLTMGETSGGTLTVTNSGSRGSLFGRAVINSPQAVIVEADLVEDRVVGTRTDSGPVFALRRRGYLSLSYDHRAFDGAYACGFLADVCAQIGERRWADDV